MDKVLIDNISAVDFSVHFRHLAQGVAAGLGEKGHKAQLHTVFFQKLIFVGVAQLHHRAHVHLVIGGEHGGRVLTVFEPAGNGLPQAGHFYALFAGRIVGRHGCARRCGHSRRRSWRGRCGNGLSHIAFHHPAIAAGSGHRIAANAGFGHGFFGRGGIFYICRRCSFGLWLARGGCGCRGSSAAAGREHGKFCIGGHGAAFCGQNLAQNTGRRGGHFNADLIGFQLAQHFILGNSIANGLEPCGNGCLGDAFAQGWDQNVEAAGCGWRLLTHGGFGGSCGRF